MSAFAVIPTRPANAPFRAMDKSGLENTIQETNAAEITPAAAANEVVVKTKPKGVGSALKTEPPLKPYQPNQSRKTPTAASGILCPGIGFTLPFSSYFPLRGPSISTQAKAANPPKACTTAEPAKSLKSIPDKTTSTPMPGTNNGICNTHEQSGKNEERTQFYTLSNSTRYDRCCSCRKHCLKDEVTVPSHC